MKWEQGAPGGRLAKSDQKSSQVWRLLLWDPSPSLQPPHTFGTDLKNEIFLQQSLLSWSLLQKSTRRLSWSVPEESGQRIRKTKGIFPLATEGNSRHWNVHGEKWKGEALRTSLGVQ